MIPIAKPCVGEDEKDAVARVLASGWLTQGREVAAFEKEFAEYVGAPEAVAVSSCTTALHLGLYALGVGAGDEVITVSHSFIATANAIVHTGARPIFVDISFEDFNMNPELVESRITHRTKAVLAVHQIGMPCRLPELASIARRKKLFLVEDAACAAGSALRMSDGRWQKIGTPVGDLVCFSFHPRKLLTTGDGGMITCNDSRLAKRLRSLRQHAMSISDVERNAASCVTFETYEEIGFNYRLTDIQAAIGREQLKRLDGFVEERRRLAEIYSRLLRLIPDVTCPHERDGVRTNWQSYCVLLQEGVEQRAIMEHMLERGIATRRAVMCAHRESPYVGSESSHDLRVSEFVQDHGLLLPLYPGMTNEEQNSVIDALQSAIANVGASMATMHA
jgi:dTDP-4-amino-4,6-dideoxygalactose transaminase